MGAAGDRLEFYERTIIFRGDDFVVSLGGAAIAVDFESGGMVEVASDWEIDFRFRDLRNTGNDCVVGFMGGALVELTLEQFFRSAIFRENHHAGSCAVEAVDDLAIIGGGRLEAKVALHDAEEAGGLVNHEYVRVFVDYVGRRGRGFFGEIESDDGFFGEEGGGVGFGFWDGFRGASGFGGVFGFGSVFGFFGGVFDRDEAVANGDAERVARVFGVFFEDELVEAALLGICFADVFLVFCFERQVAVDLAF